MLTDMLSDVEDQSVNEITDLMESVWGTMLGPDGSTYGDTDLKRGERIARVMDLAARGVLDILEVISPPTYKKLVSKYVEDIQASPLMAPVPTPEPMFAMPMAGVA